jgi:hypothetical protein
MDYNLYSVASCRGMRPHPSTAACPVTWDLPVGYVPPLPSDLADLKARARAAVKNIDTPMLTRVWQER